jgi:hypothetical protein
MTPAAPAIGRAPRRSPLATPVPIRAERSTPGPTVPAVAGSAHLALAPAHSAPAHRTVLAVAGSAHSAHSAHRVHLIHPAHQTAQAVAGLTHRAHPAHRTAPAVTHQTTPPTRKASA